MWQTFKGRGVQSCCWRSTFLKSSALTLIKHNRSSSFRSPRALDNLLDQGWIRTGRLISRNWIGHHCSKVYRAPKSTITVSSTLNHWASNNPSHGSWIEKLSHKIWGQCKSDTFPQWANLKRVISKITNPLVKTWRKPFCTR